MKSKCLQKKAKKLFERCDSELCIIIFGWRHCICIEIEPNQCDSINAFVINWKVFAC